jgi:hypothetical protein
VLSVDFVTKEKEWIMDWENKLEKSSNTLAYLIAVQAKHNLEIEKAVNQQLSERYVRLSDAEQILKNAEGLCKIYFEIASDAIGEEKVREARDNRIKELEE